MQKIVAHGPWNEAITAITKGLQAKICWKLTDMLQTVAYHFQLPIQGTNTKGGKNHKELQTFPDHPERKQSNGKGFRSIPEKQSTV